MKVVVKLFHFTNYRKCVAGFCVYILALFPGCEKEPGYEANKYLVELCSNLQRLVGTKLSKVSVFFFFSGICTDFARIRFKVFK